MEWLQNNTRCTICFNVCEHVVHAHIWQTKKKAHGIKDKTRGELCAVSSVVQNK